MALFYLQRHGLSVLRAEFPGCCLGLSGLRLRLRGPLGPGFNLGLKKLSEGSMYRSSIYIGPKVPIQGRGTWTLRASSGFSYFSY